MDLKKIAGGFKFAAIKKTLGFKDKIGKTDLGVLKVALMVAALDGEVTSAEHDAFWMFAKKCRGYTEESAAKAFDEALRSAGYLLLLARRVTPAELTKAFLLEAKAALPDGFAYYSVENIRNAIVTWIAMAMSDGDYSARERKCIEALRKHFAELKVSRDKLENERWPVLYYDLAASHGMPMATFPTNIQIVTKDFVAEVEEIVAVLGDDKSAAEKLKALVLENVL